jgi:TorA maturation chaperone TorD
MSVPAAPLHFVSTLAPEEAGRANLYGLLARLFYAPPDAALLQALACAEELAEGQGDLGQGWRALREAAAAADALTVAEEYERVFVGTGKAPVSLYTGAYTVRYASESPLAELRGELEGFGLVRRNEASEPEDHIGVLCDVMRQLIAELGIGLVEQRRFFMRWIWPAASGLCDAIDNDKSMVFYRAVGKFARSFFAVDHMAFEME